MRWGGRLGRTAGRSSGPHRIQLIDQDSPAAGDLVQCLQGRQHHGRERSGLDAAKLIAEESIRIACDLQLEPLAGRFTPDSLASVHDSRKVAVTRRQCLWGDRMALSVGRIVVDQLVRQPVG